MHADLWLAVRELVAVAENDPAHWDDVTSRATRFLETQIRNRGFAPGDGPPGRRGLVRAFDEGGPCELGDDEAQRTAWKGLVAGVLGGVGNPVSHRLSSHARSYAMGVAGAVSLVVTALDERHGPL